MVSFSFYLTIGKEKKMAINRYIGGLEYKYMAMDAAKDLGYGPEVASKIRAAKSDVEIERIMVTARKRETLKDAMGDEYDG